jgi:hypothetical protein
MKKQGIVIPSKSQDDSMTELKDNELTEMLDREYKIYH